MWCIKSEDGLNDDNDEQDYNKALENYETVGLREK